jgi:hypothetical protein
MTVGIALFDLYPQRYRGLRFSLPNTASHPQAGLRLNRGAAPILPWFISVYSFFFSCLRPT